MTARAFVIEAGLSTRCLGDLLMELADYWETAVVDFTHQGPGVRVLLDGPPNAHPSALDPSRRADG